MWDALVQKFKDNQYKTKLVKVDGKIAKLKARHDNVVISIFCHLDGILTSIMVIDENGITRAVASINKSGYMWDGKNYTPLQAVKKAIAIGATHHKDYKIDFKAYKRISGEFTPYTFNDNVISFDTSLHVWPGTAKLDSVMNNCRVLTVVGINKDGKLDSQIVMKPDERPWFHLWCKTHVSSVFEIISDGVNWYPVNRKTMKITSTCSAGSTTFNPSEMSALDRALIVKAIEHHVI